jgi:hypothetical protein
MIIDFDITDWTRCAGKVQKNNTCDNVIPGGVTFVQRLGNNTFATYDVLPNGVKSRASGSLYAWHTGVGQIFYWLYIEKTNNGDLDSLPPEED